jgi:hypothetical protein
LAWLSQSSGRCLGHEWATKFVFVDNATPVKSCGLPVRKTWTRFPGWNEWTAQRFDVESNQEVAAGIDGEAVVLEPPLRFRVEPSALRIRLPPAAAGLSPAALAPGLTRSGILSLWQIAAGRS